MKTNVKLKILGLAVFSSFFIFHSAFADLTAVVTPGYQFPTDPSLYPTNPTVVLQDLNLLGQPTISIFGTIGGSNTLAPGSVYGPSLADTLPDNVYLKWNSAGTRQLTAIPGAWAGAGLAGTSTNVGLYVDTNFFSIATNSIWSTNSNTGSVSSNWLTLTAHSLGDTNIIPGGITSASITTNGLPPQVLNMALILTNYFPVAGVTNMTTNYNTIALGGTNGLGYLELLSTPLFVQTNTPVIASYVQGGTTNYWTNMVPTLQLEANGYQFAELVGTITNYYTDTPPNWHPGVSLVTRSDNVTSNSIAYGSTGGAGVYNLVTVWFTNPATNVWYYAVQTSSPLLSPATLVSQTLSNATFQVGNTYQLNGTTTTNFAICIFR